MTKKAGKNVQLGGPRRSSRIISARLRRIARYWTFRRVPDALSSSAYNRGLRYTGVDISADMLEVARSKVPAGDERRIDRRRCSSAPLRGRRLRLCDHHQVHQVAANHGNPDRRAQGDQKSRAKEAFVQIKVTRKLPVKSRAASLLRQLPIARHVLGPVCGQERQLRQGPEAPYEPLPDRFLSKSLTKHFPRRDCMSVPSCPTATSDADATFTSFFQTGRLSVEHKESLRVFASATAD